MKAILINPFDQSIKEVDYTGDFRQIYTLIDASVFDVARISRRDGIFVDDNGLFNASHFFEHADYHSPLAGKGLIVGCDEQGESVDCETSVEEVKSKIKFYTYLELRARYA